MKNAVDRVVDKLHEQKGQLLGTQALLVGILRSLPLEQRTEAIRRFDSEIATARSELAYSTAPDEVINGLENFVRAVNQIRLVPNLD